jgi:hypothetical protein
MSYKIINLPIPINENIPNEISSFSPEENYKMIKIGCECLLEGRKAIAGLTQQEIYNKIKDESKEEVKKMELDILVERELSKKMEERIKKIYEGQIEQLKKQLDTASIHLKSYDSQNTDIINKEVSKTREKYDMLLEEKDKQNKLNRETIEKLSENVMKLTNKSASHKGSEGEKQFNNYAETFIDFKGFSIIDKHTQGGEGDFHLHFDEFDVLADAKNYKNKVPIDQREKIKNDLLKNEHIHFAWLVSLNTSIDKWEKSPIMYEWINTTQCIVYINNLSSFEDPKKILRIVWFTCKELYKLIEDINYDETELIELKEKQFKIQDKIKDIRKSIRELNTTMNTSRSIIQLMDDQLKEIIESEASNIIDSNYSLFDEWWEQNIESTNENITQNSTDLWIKFKQDHKNMIKELNISVDKFKQYLKSKVPILSLIIKNKNANSAFEIKGLKMKNQVLSIPNIITEIEIKPEPKNKVNKKIKSEYYFDKIIDKNILNDYCDINNNILIISNRYNVRPWQVVSLLIKYNIITKRDESRGYNEYKETEEYKQKLI